jgi:nucleotide-binding universal stress UspA family protein
VHGSIAEAVVHRAHLPVMLIRATGATPQVDPFGERQSTLLIPLDGSELAESALPFGTDLAQATGARLVFVSVVPKEGRLVAGMGGAITTCVGEAHTRLDAEARGYLASIVERTRASGIPTETVVRYGDAATEIVAVADTSAPAAVVMATHGRSGLVRAMVGSVASGVVHHAATPVIMIHPTGRRAEAKAPARKPRASWAEHALTDIAIGEVRAANWHTGQAQCVADSGDASRLDLADLFASQTVLGVEQTIEAKSSPS